MEIKDVTSVSPVDGTALDNSLDKHHVTAEHSGAVNVSEADSDLVIVSANVKTMEINETRLKANKAINVVNVVSDKTERIGAVFTSLEGIISQAAGKPPTVTSKLEDEGQQLISEVDSLIQEISNSASKETADGAARLALEKSVGKALDLLSTNRVKGLGLNKVELANREAILITQSKLAKVKAHYEHLRSSVTQAVKVVKDASISADVAAVRRNPSVTVIRQAEEAAKVTGRTRDDIGSDPVTAIGSIGETTGYQAQL